MTVPGGLLLGHRRTGERDHDPYPMQRHDDRRLTRLRGQAPTHGVVREGGLQPVEGSLGVDGCREEREGRLRAVELRMDDVLSHEGLRLHANPRLNGSISRWMPILSMMRIKNHGIS